MAPSVSRSTFLPRAVETSRSNLTISSKLLRLENFTNRSMSLCSVASPLAMEPKTPTIAISLRRQTSCSFFVSKGGAFIESPGVAQHRCPLNILSQLVVLVQVMRRSEEEAAAHNLIVAGRGVGWWEGLGTGG